MDCENVRERLGEYMVEGGEPGLRAGVEAHLAGCTECGRELQALRRLDRTLARLSDPASLKSVHRLPWAAGLLAASVLLAVVAWKGSPARVSRAPNGSAAVDQGPHPQGGTGAQSGHPGFGPYQWMPDPSKDSGAIPPGSWPYQWTPQLERDPFTDDPATRFPGYPSRRFEAQGRPGVSENLLPDDGRTAGIFERSDWERKMERSAFNEQADPFAKWREQSESIRTPPPQPGRGTPEEPENLENLKKAQEELPELVRKLELPAPVQDLPEAGIRNDLQRYVERACLVRTLPKEQQKRVRRAAERFAVRVASAAQELIDLWEGEEDRESETEFTERFNRFQKLLDQNMAAELDPDRYRDFLRFRKERPLTIAVERDRKRFYLVIRKDPVPASGQEGPDDIPLEQRRKISEWIEALGAPEFARRDAANRELEAWLAENGAWRAKALELLGQERSRQGDNEIQVRIDRILDRFREATRPRERGVWRIPLPNRGRRR